MKWTPRTEMQLLQLIENGKTYKQAAAELNTTEFSCRQKYRRLTGKLVK